MSDSRLTERSIIAALSRIFDSPLPPEGIGDDCSVIKVGRERILLSTDMLLQGTHFPEGLSNREKGYMAAAVNLSDIAAMGGQPRAMLVSLGIPESMRMVEIKEIALGIKDCARRYGVSIVGGDTKRASQLTISITVVGKGSGRLLLRSAAKPGQLLAITGTLGGAAAAYLKWKKEGRSTKRSRLTKPMPRVIEGIELARSGTARAAIDVTDGLALSAWYISRASGVRVEIEMDDLPLARELKELDLDDFSKREALLYWGGDYELLFTCQSSKMLDKVRDRLRTPVRVIGRVRKGSGVYLVANGAVSKLEERGYDSFGSARRTGKI